jgi:hypothetical protein
MLNYQTSLPEKFSNQQNLSLPMVIKPSLILFFTHP